MSYASAMLWYSIWFFAIVASYFASRFAVIHFDKKWKAITEEEEAAVAENAEN